MGSVHLGAVYLGALLYLAKLFRNVWKNTDTDTAGQENMKTELRDLEWHFFSRRVKIQKLKTAAVLWQDCKEVAQNHSLLWK